MQQTRKLHQIMGEHGFGGFEPSDLMAYFAQAIQGREYGKFVFSRVISAMLEKLTSFGRLYDLSREEVSHIPLGEFINLDSKRKKELEWSWHLKEVASQGVRDHRVSSVIRLPQLLVDVEGLEVVPFQISQPNFVTANSVVARLVFMDGRHPKTNLSGKVLLIENADPGYDWIFSHEISGLITKYGGANSHMAIRSAEFGIPAAIGCGDKIFEDLRSSAGVHLDCSSGTISPIREIA
jgi:phosphohistidine swiveling domain-containing protein